MNNKERFFASLTLKEVDRVSVACPLQTGTVEQMEETNAFWPEAHYDPQQMAKLALAAPTLAGIESARVPFDLCVEAETLGSVVERGRIDIQPSIKEPVLKDLGKIDELEYPDPEKDGRMAIVVEAIRLLSEETSSLPIIGGITGPFTLAGQLRGVEALLMDIYDNPAIVRKLLRFSQEVLTLYGKALERNGADAILIIDPSAGSELLGKKHYEEVAFPYCSGLVKSLSSPTILHICGDSKPILDLMVKTGVDGVSLDHLVDIKDAKKIIGNRASIIGNINPTGTLFLGDPEKIRKEARECIRKGVNILAPGCGIPPRTKLENIRAMVEAAKESENK